MSYTYRGKGTAPKTATNTSLLGYVIAYLQEEQQRTKRRYNVDMETEWIKECVEHAIDAYNAGAR